MGREIGPDGSVLSVDGSAIAAGSDNSVVYFFET
jgi:hypothetical protein